MNQNTFSFLVVYKGILVLTKDGLSGRTRRSNGTSVSIIFLSTSVEKLSFPTKASPQKRFSIPRGAKEKPGNFNNFLGALGVLGVISLIRVRKERRKLERIRKQGSVVHRKFFENVGKKRNFKSPIYTLRSRRSVQRSFQF